MKFTQEQIDEIERVWALSIKSGDIRWKRFRELLTSSHENTPPIKKRSL